MQQSTIGQRARWSMLVLIMTIVPATFAAAPVNVTFFGSKALHGYDPVAYFADSKPVEGLPEFELEWMGAKWRFASAEHRDLFKAQPEKYAPQYGGYCAFAVAKSKLVDIDPAAWSIIDGKLYLNYDLDIQKQWKADAAGFIAKADKNWPTLVK